MTGVKRKLNSFDVIDVLTDLFILRGPPAFIRSDNGPEFVAEAVRDWISADGAKAVYIEVDLVQMKRLELQARHIRTETDETASCPKRHQVIVYLAGRVNEVRCRVIEIFLQDLFGLVEPRLDLRVLKQLIVFGYDIVPVAGRRGLRSKLTTDRIH